MNDPENGALILFLELCHRIYDEMNLITFFVRFCTLSLILSPLSADEYKTKQFCPILGGRWQISVRSELQCWLGRSTELFLWKQVNYEFEDLRHWCVASTIGKSKESQALGCTFWSAVFSEGGIFPYLRLRYLTGPSVGDRTIKPDPEGAQTKWPADHCIWHCAFCRREPQWGYDLSNVIRIKPCASPRFEVFIPSNVVWCCLNCGMDAGISCGVGIPMYARTPFSFTANPHYLLHRIPKFFSVMILNFLSGSPRLNRIENQKVENTWVWRLRMFPGIIPFSAQPWMWIFGVHKDPKDEGAPLHFCTQDCHAHKNQALSLKSLQTYWKRKTFLD